jgi:hypothetical protein
MLRTYSVTVVTEIDFVDSPSAEVVHSHLERIIKNVKAGAESVSTRVTGSVRVPYCGGTIVTVAGAPEP